MNHQTTAANTSPLVKYPAGALLRAGDICSDRRRGRVGLLPFTERWWRKLVAEGKAPPGECIGTRTRVWRVEVVLDVARRLQEQGRKARVPVGAVDALHKTGADET